jgi:uncharacterized protein (UPF0212 family)
MKCPECGKDLNSVNVYSQCLQKADIDEDGNITNYGSVETVLDTQGIECPFCANDITNLVKE